MPAPTTSSEQQPSILEQGRLDSALVTFREIYEHLETSQHRRGVEEVQALLEARAEQLSRCDNPFPAPSSTSSSKVASGTVQLSQGQTIKLDEEQKDLTTRISERYALDEVVAATMLRSFLESEDRSLDLLTSLPPEDAKRKGKRRQTSEKDEFKQDVLDAFNVFFFEERLYILRTVCALLRISNDPAHDFHEVSLTILNRFADQSFALRCLDRFDSLSREQLADQVRDIPRYATFWAKHKLREQLGVLEVVFLLFYIRLPASTESVLHSITTLNATDMGCQQANSGFFDSEANGLVSCISHMLLIICVETLELEQVMDGVDLREASAASTSKGKGAVTANGQHLIEEPTILDEVLDILERTASDAHRSPLLLAWALVTNRIDSALSERRQEGPLPMRLRDLDSVISTDDGGGPVWTRLATAAFAPSMQLFGTIGALLSSPLMATSSSPLSNAFTASSLAYRSIVKGLVLSITELVRPEFIPDYEGLVTLWEIMFGGGASAEFGSLLGEDAADLCVQFWDSDYEFDTRRGVLETARRRWPISFLPLVRLARALTGAASAKPLSDTGDIRSDGVSRASHAVLQYLSHLPTIAHILPPANRLLAPEYEPFESEDYSSNSYRATRRIPVFGQRTFIEKGSIGTVISDTGPAPVVVVWNLEEPISGWQLMLDVLASFAGSLQQVTSILHGEGSDSMRASEANVFQDSSEQLAPTSFADLSPDTTPEQLSAVQAEILDLFSAVIASGPEQAMALFGHLNDGRDSGNATTDPTEIVMRILDQALAAQSPNARLIASAHSFLVAILAYKPAEVWIALRSCDIITGTSKSASQRLQQNSMFGRGSAIFAPHSSILSAEITRGSFRATVAMLDLILALLLELQRSQFSSHPEQLRIKVEVVRRGMEWVLTSVWPEYQSWRYTHLREKLRIGFQCTRMFETILADRSLQTPAEGECSALLAGLTGTFILNATLVQLSPLVSTLGSASALVDELNSIGRQGEVQIAEKLVETSLRFARLIVLRRQELDIERTIDTSHLCLLEQLFFDHATVATRTTRRDSGRATKIELANAIISLVLAPLSITINAEAARLVQAICNSTSEVAESHAARVGSLPSVPSLAGFLGTTTELEGTLTALVDLVSNTHQDPNLRIDVWIMLAAIIESQPSLAILLLTGRHLAQTTERQLADERHNSSQGASQALRRTTLEVAAQSVEIWEEYWTSDPQLLEGILRFLCVVWVHGVEHAEAFEVLRSKQSFWDAISDIARNSVGSVPSRPSSFEEVDGVVRTDKHMAVRDYAHRTICKARAVQLLAIDLQLPPLAGQTHNSLSLNACVAIMRDSSKLESVLRSAVCINCDPELHADVHNRMTATIPEVPLSAVRNPQRRGHLDLDRQYGDDYVYDSALLRCKLEGFIDLEVSAQEEELDAVTIRQASLLVAAVNLDWSIVDAEMTLLRAWTSLFELALGRVIVVTAGKQAEDDVERSCTSAWIACARIAIDERCGGNLKLSIHTERTKLLTVLLEASWPQRPDHTQGEAPDETEGSIAAVERIMQLACELLEHDVFSIIDSARALRGPPFFRDLFRIVLLTTRRFRYGLKWTSDNAPARLQSERHRRLHKCADIFSAHVIACLRVAIDRASRLGGAESTAMSEMIQAEDDLTLLVSALELLLRPDFGIVPHYWLSQFQQSGLLSSCANLLSCAPLINAQGLLASAGPTIGSRLLYSFPMLFLALAIASQSGPAEQLATAGFMSALTSNGLTSAIESGPLPAILSSGERNPAHASWVLMLRSTARLVVQLSYPGTTVTPWTGPGTRFVEADVIGFVRVYGSRISAALDFSHLLSSRGVQRRNAVTHDTTERNQLLSVVQLEETLAVVQLFLCMARGHVAESAQDHTPTSAILSTFAAASAKLLQQLVYLLQHPRELASLINAGIDTFELSHAEKLQLLREEDEAIALVRDTAAAVVHALWEHSNGALILLSDPPNWRGAQMTIKATTRTSANDTASLGTLFDLVAYASEHLRTPALDSSVATADILLIEQALALCATQLAVSAYSKADATNGRLDMEAGVTRDLLTSLAGARGALVDASTAAAAARTETEPPMLQTLENFVRSRLITTRAKSLS